MEHINRKFFLSSYLVFHCFGVYKHRIKVLKAGHLKQEIENKSKTKSL